MTTSLNYAIKYVSDMDMAVAFYSKQLGLRLRFQSPDWSEFETGATTLALHTASEEHPAGSCQLGFTVPDIDNFYSMRLNDGVVFTSPPTTMHGHKIASFVDEDGAECSVSGA